MSNASNTASLERVVITYKLGSLPGGGSDRLLGGLHLLGSILPSAGLPRQLLLRQLQLLLQVPVLLEQLARVQRLLPQQRLHAGDG